jgi:hypothetical protein
MVKNTTAATLTQSKWPLHSKQAPSVRPTLKHNHPLRAFLVKLHRKDC